MKDEKWGDTAYYTDVSGDVPQICSARILKHGRVYITCDYNRETKFDKTTGIEAKDWGNKKIFFPTHAEAERYINRKKLKTDIREWFSWMSFSRLDKLTDAELLTVHDILMAAEQRKA